jgi:hypothetical protein
MNFFKKSKQDELSEVEAKLDSCNHAIGAIGNRQAFAKVGDKAYNECYAKIAKIEKTMAELNEKKAALKAEILAEAKAEAAARTAAGKGAKPHTIFPFGYTGLWTCACGRENYIELLYCLSCKRERPNTVKTKGKSIDCRGVDGVTGGDHLNTYTAEELSKRVRGGEPKEVNSSDEVIPMREEAAKQDRERKLSPSRFGPKGEPK